MPRRVKPLSFLSLLLTLVLLAACTPKSGSQPDQSHSGTDGVTSGEGTGDGDGPNAGREPASIPPPTSSAGEDPVTSAAPPPKPSASVGQDRVSSAPPPPSAVKPVPVPTMAPVPAPNRVETSEPVVAAPVEEMTSASAGGLIREIGSILYNPPTEMTLNKAETVEVRIGKEEVSDVGLSGSGGVQRDRLPITQIMSVRLCCGSPEADAPFDIVSNSKEEQLVNDPLLAEGEFTEWVFQVTPREKGEQRLQLFVTAHYTFEDGRTASKDQVLNRNIVIQVDTVTEVWSWIAENWYWFGLLLVIPLSAFLINRRNQRSNLTPIPSGNESIFISYRRDDSSGHTLAVYEKLKSALGDENVFMDLDDIPHGANFADHIEKVLSKADTVLVMIGPDWLAASNAQGRRLDDPQDFVRMEVATALEKDLRVIPVLLRGAEMPTFESLPDVLQDLSMRNAIRIHDDQFDASIERLMSSVFQ